MSHHLYILLLLAGVVSACSPAVHESRHTLYVADSLRVNEGRLYDDSLALAEAYTLLGHWRLIYPDDYARACYYYGRMLRHRGDQVAAMRAFINGTHAPYMQRVVPLPWLSDYHILGRIYSNMGTMCHLDEDYVHAYEMYQKSASLFILSYDSTAYYYALNSMAFCMAMQMNRNETLRLINDIQSHCLDSNVLAKTWETKAIMYETFEVHDSAIIAINNMYNPEIFGTTAYTIKAQAFSHIGIHDSALYYAQRVMANSSASYQDMYNALYILTNKDSLLISSAKDSLIAIRADIGICRRNEANLLGHAVEQVQHDKDRKPYYINIGLLILSLCIVGGIAWIAVVRIRRHRKRVYAETEQERQKQQELRKQQKDLEKQNANILADMSRLQSSNDALRQENADLSVLHSERRAELMAQIINNCDAIRNSEKWKDVFYWNKHDKLCEVADKHLNLLSTKLQMLEVLNEREIHLCILVTIGNFSDKQLAQLLNYSEKSIRSIKLNAAKKLGTTSAHLHDFLMQKATE